MIRPESLGLASGPAAAKDLETWKKDHDAQGKMPHNLGALVMEDDETSRRDFEGSNLTIDDSKRFNARETRTDVSDESRPKQPRYSARPVWHGSGKVGEKLLKEDKTVKEAVIAEGYLTEGEAEDVLAGGDDRARDSRGRLYRSTERSIVLTRYSSGANLSMIPSTGITGEPH